MPLYDSRFASYATRVAFDIRLTRPQIFYLCFAAQYPKHSADRERNWANFEAFHKVEQLHIGRGITVPQMQALIQRGLVEHNEAVKTRTARAGDWFYRLTPAGEHIYALLKIAGLAVQFDMPANEERPRQRAKAARG